MKASSTLARPLKQPEFRVVFTKRGLELAREGVRKSFELAFGMNLRKKKEEERRAALDASIKTATEAAKRLGNRYFLMREIVEKVQLKSILELQKDGGKLKTGEGKMFRILDDVGFWDDSYRDRVPKKRYSNEDYFIVHSSNKEDPMGFYHDVTRFSRQGVLLLIEVSKIYVEGKTNREKDVQKLLEQKLTLKTPIIKVS